MKDKRFNILLGFALALCIHFPTAVLAQGYIPVPYTHVVSGANCSLCAHVQSTNSGSSGVHTDPTTLNGVVAGHMLIVFSFHDHQVSGTTTVSDDHSNTWYPCSGTTANGAFTDIVVGGAGTAKEGFACNYALNVGSGNTTITPQSSDCAVSNCTVGASYLEYSGVATTPAAAWDNSASLASGTSAAGSNNTNCGTASTSQTNDLVICATEQFTGATTTAGTSPVTFTLRQPATNAGVEDVIWTSSGSMNAKATDSGSSDSYAGIEVFFK